MQSGNIQKKLLLIERMKAIMAEKAQGGLTSLKSYISFDSVPCEKSDNKFTRLDSPKTPISTLDRKLEIIRRRKAEMTASPSSLSSVSPTKIATVSSSKSSASLSSPLILDTLQANANALEQSNVKDTILARKLEIIRVKKADMEQARREINHLAAKEAFSRNLTLQRKLQIIKARKDQSLEDRKANHAAKLVVRYSKPFQNTLLSPAIKLNSQTSNVVTSYDRKLEIIRRRKAINSRKAEKNSKESAIVELQESLIRFPAKRMRLASKQLSTSSFCKFFNKTGVVPYLMIFNLLQQENAKKKLLVNLSMILLKYIAYSNCVAIYWNDFF